MKKVIFSIFSIGILLNAVEVDSTTVIDNKTRLEWQDDYSNNSNIVKKAIWIDAIAYCKDLRLNEKFDWRLPNINELESIVDRSSDSSTLFINGFTKVDASLYWSSTSLNAKGWSIDFSIGSSTFSPKGDSYSIRCVRDSQ